MGSGSPPLYGTRIALLYTTLVAAALCRRYFVHYIAFTTSDYYYLHFIEPWLLSLHET